MGEAPIEYEVYGLLKELGIRLATAESATGGMVASTLINVPGISEYFSEGYITYSDAAKVKMIHVPQSTIERYGVVSEQTALAMAECAAREAGADAAISVTGVAGPGGGTRECPVGLVFIGCALCGEVEARRFLFEGDRARVREAATREALSFLLERLRRLKTGGTRDADHRG